jgi:hypothetical protein
MGDGKRAAGSIDAWLSGTWPPVSGDETAATETTLKAVPGAPVAAEV